MQNVPDNRLSSVAPLPRTVMRGKTREANPKRRKKAFDDRAVLIATPVLAARPTGVAADRKVRGSRKRGYRKPRL